MFTRREFAKLVAVSGLVTFSSEATVDADGHDRDFSGKHRRAKVDRSDDYSIPTNTMFCGQGTRNC
jgi:hypothetical protein